MTKATICLGDEYDDALREAVVAILQEMGAVIMGHTRGMAGSQELEVVRASIEGRTLIIEAETYTGLSVKGEQVLVEEIARRVKDRRAAITPPQVAPKLGSSEP